SILNKKIQIFRNQFKKIFGSKLLSLVKEKDIILVTIIPSFFILIWMIWSYLYVGTIFPISGQPRNIKFLSESYNLKVFYAIKDTIAFIINLIFYPPERYLTQLIISLIVYGIPLFLISYQWLFKKKQFVREIFKNFNFIFFYIILNYPFYWFIELRFRAWYTQVSSFFVILFYSLIIVYLIEEFLKQRFKKIIFKKISRKQIYLLFYAFLGINFVFNGILIWRYPLGYCNDLRYQVALYIDENIPEYYVLGSYNTGVIQFFTKKHDIINLDGFINPEAYHAIINNNLQDYIIEKNISYIINGCGFPSDLNQSKLEMIMIKKFIIPYSSLHTESKIDFCEIYIWKIKIK
ncbi:MAG: hypothetical protein ACTSYC_08210, partial [Promethearchaeota archaeon]